MGPEPPSPLSVSLKRDLTEIIRWTDANTARSLQVAIGPSELGTECDRELAYRLAGNEEVNHLMDPWPAIVGTAIHDWTERAVQKFMATFGNGDWLTEVTLDVDPLVCGHSDLYRISSATVVDLKTCGPTVFKKIKVDGPPLGHKRQTQLYGLGHTRMGRRVESVALVFVPRAGWLRDMVVWSAPYDQAEAEAVLARMYQLASVLLVLEVEQFPERFQQVTATPSDHCAFCPFFVPNKDPGATADQFGCPGR